MTKKRTISLTTLQVFSFVFYFSLFFLSHICLLNNENGMLFTSYLYHFWSNVPVRVLILVLTFLRKFSSSLDCLVHCSKYIPRRLYLIWREVFGRAIRAHIQFWLLYAFFIEISFFSSFFVMFFTTTRRQAVVTCKLDLIGWNILVLQRMNTTFTTTTYIGTCMYTVYCNHHAPCILLWRRRCTSTLLCASFCNKCHSLRVRGRMWVRAALAQFDDESICLCVLVATV